MNSIKNKIIKFFKEMGVNTLSGLVSFAGGLVGGFLGYRYPYSKYKYPWYYNMCLFLEKGYLEIIITSLLKAGISLLK